MRDKMNVCAVNIAAVAAIAVFTAFAQVTPQTAWWDVPPTNTLAEVAAGAGLATTGEVARKLDIVHPIADGGLWVEEENEGGGANISIVDKDWMHEFALWWDPDSGPLMWYADGNNYSEYRFGRPNIEDEVAVLGDIPTNYLHESYEYLTNSLAQEAWKIFLKVEEEGGFLAAVKAGTIQDDINATNAKRHGDAAKRKEFLLGTNQFPNFTEVSENKRPLEGSCVCGCGNDKDAGFKAISSTRLAADFENLRIHTESTKTPTAFMLTIGNLAMRQARAQFSCNFLACAGYKVIDNLGFETVEAGVDAALEAGADIVVICSSDDEYAEYAIPAYQDLDGRAMFVVAGAPACMEDLKAAGIENFIHVKCNVLETLREYNQKLGIGI